MQGPNVCFSRVKVKFVVPREHAIRDVCDAAAHYLDERAASAALDFIDALELAYTRIGRHPGTG